MLFNTLPVVASMMFNLDVVPNVTEYTLSCAIFNVLDQLENLWIGSGVDHVGDVVESIYSFVHHLVGFF